MKLKSQKIKKLEKDRYSILASDLDVCFVCGRCRDHLHEVFFGNNRINSMKYGCVVPLCERCHSFVHSHRGLDLELKKKAQRAFLDVYGCDVDSFIEIFRINYL